MKYKVGDKVKFTEKMYKHYSFPKEYPIRNTIYTIVKIIYSGIYVDTRNEKWTNLDRWRCWEGEIELATEKQLMLFD